MAKDSKTDKSAALIDLTCMKASFAPGVSEPSTLLGFTADQMESIVSQLVKQEHDDLVVISEYNPAIEKVKTGNMILSMVRWFLLGWIQGTEKK